MGDYNRTLWKDHIKDQNGNVIQQGTPVSAKNLNNMENQIVALSAKENSLAELVREAIPSGFTTLSDLDYSYMSTNPNSIRLTNDSVAYVNGYKIVIPSGTVINLNAPPTSGSRDDLVFLEAWKQADANGAEQLSWRIRVASGVDFTKYPEGLGTYCPTLYTPEYRNLVQGGNGSPIIENWNTTFKLTGKGFLGQWVDFSAFTDFKDLGLYVSGNGSDGDKTLLKTLNGYVYAIPIFKVHRRNSGGYSAGNANGSIIQSFYGTNKNNQNVNDTVIMCAGNSGTTSVTGLNAGDKIRFALYNNSSQYFIRTITSIDTTNKTITLDSGIPYSISSGTYYIMRETFRADRLYADIIYDRDIIDLRHKVSLTGFNYQSLLEENFDKLLRGELQTTAKTTMLKTYHGISKTPIDANTVFYASMDGTTTAEIGGAPISGGTAVFASSPTGLACRPTGSNIIYNNITLGNTFTLDFWIDTNKLFNDFVLFQFGIDCRIEIHPNCLYLCGSLSPNADKSNYNLNWIVNNSYRHIRVVVSGTNRTLYVNGKQQFQVSNASNFTGNNSSVAFVPTNTPISDIAISNIDRGSAFATLPQDFVDGYSRIAPAFNSQRSVFSDALTSETPLAQVKCAGGNSKEITVGDSSVFPKVDTAKWNVNDRVKIKGLGGEIISGVIDGDTALARILNIGKNTLTVDNVSKLSVGDTINILPFSTNVMSTGWIINTIDSINNIITLNSDLDINVVKQGDLLFETTASSSSPVVKANLTGTAQAGTSSTITLGSSFNATDGVYNGLTITIISGTGAGQARTISGYVGGTKVATVSNAWTTAPDATSVYLITGVPITGTWSGLGTNEATFTLGTNSGLVAQDLLINYSLNEFSGQGGISEVLTTTLAGESNGKKLVVNPPSVHVRDDFAGKVRGSTTVCPNKSFYANRNTYTSLLAPSVFTQFDANLDEMDASSNSHGYVWLGALDGACTQVSVNANGAVPQQLFSFNLIRIVEDKFGTLPCEPDTASKVAWLKTNLKSIVCNWWGYGSCPSGGTHANPNYACLAMWDGTSWQKIYELSSKVVPTLATFNNTDMNRIDQNGFVNFLAYTDASDGVTPSTIYSDYANIEITLATQTGYDVLVPENPRRDDGKGNILLVRKETKEIQVMFPRSNTDGVVTYGEYNGLTPNVDYSGIALTSPVGFITTLGTGGVARPNLRGISSSKYIMGWIGSSLCNLKGDDLLDNNALAVGWAKDSFFIKNLALIKSTYILGTNGFPVYDADLGDLDVGRTINNSDRLFTIRDTSIDYTKPHMVGAYQLVKFNGKLMLRVIIDPLSINTSSLYLGRNCCLFEITNRPLVK